MKEQPEIHEKNIFSVLSFIVKQNIQFESPCEFQTLNKILPSFDIRVPLVNQSPMKFINKFILTKEKLKTFAK